MRKLQFLQIQLLQVTRLVLIVASGVSRLIFFVGVVLEYVTISTEWGLVLSTGKKVGHFLPHAVTSFSLSRRTSHHGWGGGKHLSFTKPGRHGCGH